MMSLFTKTAWMLTTVVVAMNGASLDVAIPIVGIAKIEKIDRFQKKSLIKFQKIIV